MTLGFVFPRQWQYQQEADEKTPPAFIVDDSKYVFKEMLPECVGFIATNGKVVLYGSHYKSLYDQGLII